MQFLDVRALPGPNIHTHRPALVALLDLGELTGRETHEFDGFTDRLLATLPGLGEHHCGLGYPGGFVERLRGGTYFGHVVEHVAIEMQTMAGCNVHHGKTRQTRQPNVFRLVVEYCNAHVGKYLLAEARKLVEATLAGQSYPVAETVAEAKRIFAQTELGPSTKAIADAAARRGIPVIRLDEDSLVQLGYGVHRRLIQAAETTNTSSVSVEIACDKARTKALLELAFIPVPRGAVVRTAADAVRQLGELNPPLAIKPLDGNQGNGVTLNLHTATQVKEAFARAAEIGRDVVVEEQFNGRDYRVLVVGGRVVAASERTPASVVGDGKHSVAELIAIENASNPLRGDGHEKPLTQIRVDDEVREHLRKSGRSLEEVPRAGERLMLRGTANLSTGGTAKDVTDDLHPDVARLCERAARVVGLDVCGIDLITPDISKPVPEHGAGIIEVNAAPGLRMHHYPSAGTPRDVGAAIVDTLFPRGSTGRVPIVAITGTNGKTTVTRMIADVVSGSGKMVGMTTTDGIWLDGHPVARGDMTGFNSARVVLGDPSVEVAVLETARGGIVRRSLGYDWSDVGVMTNVSADHLGQDGIETIEDLLHAKTLVAERVRPGGTVVLNADDPHLVKLPGRRHIEPDQKRIVFFSLRPDNEVVRRHLAAGGTAYWAEDGWLVEGTGRSVRRIVAEGDVPVTFGGLARFQVANALAAAAAARALGLTVEQIAAALSGFDGGGHNPGRMNLFKVGHGYALVDYGHNPAAFEAVAALATHWTDRRVTAVFTAPGDRDDELIRESGRVVARGFDRVVIREDKDRRGRRPGEVSRLLCEAAHDAEPDVECDTVLDEAQAVRSALERMTDDEIVVIFYEDYDLVVNILKEFGAETAASVGPALAVH